MKKPNNVVIISLLIGITLTSLIVLDNLFGDMDFTNPISTKGRIFKDSLGREVNVPKHPERIISLAPSITEIIFSLDGDDRLVGVTSYCNYPEEAKNKQSVGSFSTPNIEIIVSLQPDLIIGAKDDQMVIDQLESYDISIVVLLASSLNEIFENIDNVGWLIDEESNAQIVVANMKENMDLITSYTSEINSNDKLSCYFEVWETPKVAGYRSFISDMICKAGGINIFEDIDEDFPIVSHESVISKNPDVIFVCAMGRKYYSCDISERDGYDSIKAVKNNRIYECNDDSFTRAGPRIVEALENMTLHLYPTIFN